MQTFRNFEVLIMDGSSTDGTISIAKSYKAGLDLQCYSEKDKGIYDAMNKGIALANGEYLYFMGSDDTLFNENILAAVASELNSKQSPIFYGNVLMINNKTDQKNIHAGEFDLKRLFSHNICHQSLFYHNSVFNTIGNYNTKYPVLADYDLNLRCAARYPLQYMDIIIANFYLGGSSTQLADTAFEQDKDTNIIKYYLHKIHSRKFINLRLIIQRAAFSSRVKINWPTRLYCILVYTKLKTQSLF